MKPPTRTPSRQASKAKPSQGLLIYGKVTSPAPRRAPSSTERGPREFATKVAKAVFGYVEIDPLALQVQLSDFLKKMHEVVQKLPGKVGEFSVDTVELSVEISAKGTVALLGTGGEAAAQGALKFTLKRK